MFNLIWHTNFFEQIRWNSGNHRVTRFALPGYTVKMFKKETLFIAWCQICGGVTVLVGTWMALWCHTSSRVIDDGIILILRISLRFCTRLQYWLRVLAQPSSESLDVVHFSRSPIVHTGYLIPSVVTCLCTL